MGGMTQTLTGADMTDYFQNSMKSIAEQMKEDFDPRWGEPATLRDLRIALIRIENEFDSMRNYIDSQISNTKQK